MSRTRVKILAGALGAGFALFHARADLVATSPFVPQGAAAYTPTQQTALELRGVMVEGGETKFSIFDPVKKSGTWVGMNESGYDFSVKKYDPSNDTVTVDYQGRSLSVTLRAAKIASSGVAVQPMAPMPMASVLPGGIPPPQNPLTRNVVANPTPATEAARLADWQAEIQRRRELRAQQSTIVPGVAPSTPPPAAVDPAAQGPQTRASRRPRQP